MIDRIVQLPTAAIATPNAMDLLMASSKPTLKQYESKWSGDNVLNFQIAYEISNNKEKYLSSLPKKNKPSIDVQYQAFVACFINDCGLGYTGEAGEKKKLQRMH